MREAAMENPTIVVITDRNDLDGQLLGVFSLSQELLREQPVQGETRQELRAKLANRPSGGIVFATIQKFMPGEDEDSFPVLSDRHNIVVIADEAHRTQYGFEARFKGDARGIRWAMPSICVMHCPMQPLWPLPAPRCHPKTATHGPYSATTSASTTCSSPAMTGQPWRSILNHVWPSWG
jgi:hypothetical protein